MTKKQVKIAWIAGGSLVGIIVIAKILAARSAARAAALRTQQLNAASPNPAAQAAAALPTAPPLMAPLAPITADTIVAIDPTLSTAPAPTNVAPIAIV